MAARILVVDDQADIVRVLRGYLEQAGFTVLTANDGHEALRIARQEKPALVVLDLMLPGMDGIDVCRALRKEGDIPIIMLTARVEEADRIVGLELGADDYVTKPFSPREVVARVHAILRRAGMDVPRAEIVRAADIVLDRGTHRVFVGERLVDLTPSEFDLLSALMSAPGRVFSRLDLLDRIQGIRYEGYDRTIDVHIRNLRAKIESDPRHPRYVETVYGVGYRFAEE